MDEFTQPQAAHLSGYDERTFRSLLDKRIILPTPATRTTGRGKAKMFDRHEVKVASILRRISHGLSPHDQAAVADWLRRELADAHRSSTETHPYYVVLEHLGDGDWRGEFRAASGHIYGDNKEGAEKRISVMLAERPSPAFFAVNIGAALWWDGLKGDQLQGVLQEAEAPAE